MNRELTATDRSHDTLASANRDELRRYIWLRLAALRPELAPRASELDPVAARFLSRYREQARLLREQRSPVDERIEEFLGVHFGSAEIGDSLRVPAPSETLILDRPGMARELSLPEHGDEFKSAILSSHRVRNGVLHNPLHDRRTTAGTFHVAAGGPDAPGQLPIPASKKTVPPITFARLFHHATHPPGEALDLPFTCERDSPVRVFVSLLLRPIVCPEVPGFTPRKTMETRFFAPASLVSNLDFVESIFGNGGDPYLPENDAGLDVEHWTGHTGCVILAPHLVTLRKRDVGLPHWDDASESQRRDGMCWKTDDECYNDGVPFKLTYRTSDGVMVTLISDNYFGYCKKEVKTQLNFAANLYGNVEEEHAGGALVFPSYNLGDRFQANSRKYNSRGFEDVARDYADRIDVHEDGYAVDREYHRLVFVNERAVFDLPRQTVTWKKDGKPRSLPLLADRVYMTPSGYKVHIERHPGAPSWRLVGTVGDGVFCHKPCTVSGGGKSEISKALDGYLLYGPIFVADQDEDFAALENIIARNYGDRWADYDGETPVKSRSFLDPERSLGSVIKMLTPSPKDFNQAYNDWLGTIPDHVFALAFIIKRFYHESWEGDWRDRFSVDEVNGAPGHELKFGSRKLVGSYLRVGSSASTAWRTFKLRQDFLPAAKIQLEDDITASVVVPASALSHLGEAASADSVKLLTNCERRLFQRPDDAIHRGLDKQTERDLTARDNFLSNFQPLPLEDIERMVERVVDLEQFTPPMREFLRGAVDDRSAFVVCSANPRVINGKRSKNPRYLQLRPDLADSFPRYVAEFGQQLRRAAPGDRSVPTPVNAVLFGRRNNAPDRENGIRGLSVYNPLHYQELPELFMDFIASLTGKSPSTTGAGSEGALTKGPFNALRPMADLNNALVSYLLTGLHGFSTPAGYVGNVPFGHDVSFLIPELWCRLSPEERDPANLIENEYLAPVPDITDKNGRTIPASRLGYRITSRFVRAYLGRVFDHPSRVFDDSILRPELQNEEDYADGVLHIAEAHQRVAQRHFDDGTVDDACPPLRALLEIMAHGDSNGRDVRHPEIRALFTLSALKESDWYRRRLETKQARDIDLWTRHVHRLERFEGEAGMREEERPVGVDIDERLALARRELTRVSSPEYLTSLDGTLGADLLGPHP